MFSKSKQYNLITKLSVGILTSIVLISCDGESSSNSNNDRNEVIDRSIDVDGEDLITGDNTITETFNITDGDGNTVSCDSTEVEFDDNDFPICPDSE